MNGTHALRIVMLCGLAAACQSSDTLEGPEGSALAPAAHGAVVVVWPGDLDGWTPSPTVTFEDGPAGPPLGAGSAELRPGAFAISQLRNRDYHLVRLATLTELEYWTYIETSPPRAPVIMLNIDLDADGDPVPDDILIFDPIHQASFCPSFPQPAPAANLWQEWDALNGCWYFADGTSGTGPGAGVQPLSFIIADQPDAQIVNLSATQGGVRVAAGTGSTGDPDWTGFVGNADAFSIAYTDKATTYDFELENDPVSRADCADGGWERYGFKNQGQCNRFVETGKDRR